MGECWSELGFHPQRVNESSVLLVTLVDERHYQDRDGQNVGQRLVFIYSEFNVCSCFVILVDERHPQNHGWMAGGKSVFIYNESISVCVCHLSGWETSTEPWVNGWLELGLLLQRLNKCFVFCHVNGWETSTDRDSQLLVRGRFHLQWINKCLCLFPLVDERHPQTETANCLVGGRLTLILYITLI
jgi:hypothetical protein